jgi:branched-subunit amino acid transport protein
MNLTAADLSPFLVLLLAGFLPTEIWRVLGLFFSKGIDENSEIFKWVKAVATATLAAVVAKIAFFPSGALADVHFLIRLVALFSGVAGFYVLKRSVLAGVLTGQVVLLLGMVMR